MNAPSLLSATQAAAQLGVNVSTFLRWVETDRAPAADFTHTKGGLWLPETIDLFAREKEAA